MAPDEDEVSGWVSAISSAIVKAEDSTAPRIASNMSRSYSSTIDIGEEIKSSPPTSSKEDDHFLLVKKRQECLLDEFDKKLKLSWYELFYFICATLYTSSVILVRDESKVVS